MPWAYVCKKDRKRAYKGQNEGHRPKNFFCSASIKNCFFCKCDGPLENIRVSNVLFHIWLVTLLPKWVGFPSTKLLNIAPNICCWINKVKMCFIMRVMCFSVLYMLRVSDIFTQRFVLQQELIRDRLVDSTLEPDLYLIKRFIWLGPDLVVTKMFKNFQKGKTIYKNIIIRL